MNGGIARVVNLMMRRTHEQMAEPSGERDPQLGVLQMHIEINEEHQDDVVLGKHVLMRGLAEHKVADAVGGADEDGEDVEEDAHIDRMHAEIGQRCQHGRRMVHFVEFPQERDAVRQIMIEPITELVGQEQRDGDDCPERQRRQRRRRTGAERSRQ